MEKIKRKIILFDGDPQREIVEEILDELKVKKALREKFHKMIGNLHKEELDRDKLYEIIRTNYSLMN